MPKVSGAGVFHEEYSFGEEPGHCKRTMNHEFSNRENTKGFCFLTNAARFREARCGFLGAAYQECPEKEFSIRSIPLVKSPGNW